MAAIDEQIAHLRQIRELIAGSSPPSAVPSRRGRPKGSGKKTVAAVGKRVMSVEGRARIAAAQKLSWAAQKSTKHGQNAAKKSVVKSPTGKKSVAEKLVEQA